MYVELQLKDREKIAHLLRRFGLGAGRSEVDAYEPLGVDGTIQRLIDYETVDEQFPIDPWEVTGYGNEGLIRFDSTQFGSWWALRMLMTRRPLQERLTLFWHDHFAVSAEKVFDGPSMLEYQQVLRRNASGNFRRLLKDVSKTVAMTFYLDTNRSFKSAPNENFAREALELFTLGRGNYTEKDIREAARAFTGWSIHYVGIGDETPFEKLAEQWARQGSSVFSFCEVPALHDTGPKTVLGKTANFNGDQLLDHLCDQPATHRHIASKLASWFLENAPSPALIEKLAAKLRSSNLELKPVLRMIAESNEFWSEKEIRAKPKSPLDYYAGFFRALALHPILLQLRGEVRDKFKPMRPEVRGAGDGLYFLMSREGLLLHYPPNVGGWEWGQAWITTANVAYRNQLPAIVFMGEDRNRPIAVYVAGKLLNDYKVRDSASIVSALIDIFDAPTSAEKREILIQACDQAGGVSSLKDKERASQLLVRVVGLMVADPSFQLC